MTRRPRLFSHQPEVIWVPHLDAFVHTRLRLGVDRAEVEEDLTEALFWGEIAHGDAAVAAFCAEYFDLSASVFPVELDAHGRWQRVQE